MSRSAEERGDRLVATMIAHAVRAGALRSGAREYPEAAKGLTMAADFHSAKVGAFAGEMLARLAA